MFQIYHPTQKKKRDAEEAEINNKKLLREKAARIAEAKAKKQRVGYNQSSISPDVDRISLVVRLRQPSTKLQPIGNGWSGEILAEPIIRKLKPYNSLGELCVRQEVRGLRKNFSTLIDARLNNTKFEIKGLHLGLYKKPQEQRHTWFTEIPKEPHTIETSQNQVAGCHTLIKTERYDPTLKQKIKKEELIPGFFCITLTQYVYHHNIDPNDTNKYIMYKSFLIPPWTLRDINSDEVYEITKGPMIQLSRDYIGQNKKI